MKLEESSTAPARTPSGGFKTSTGTLYVSRPVGTKTSTKLRTHVSFVPRNSVFDINDERSAANEFRGFFTLFWISIFIFTINTYVRSIEASGRPLNLHFFNMISEDAITLAVTDAILVLSTGICVPLAMAMRDGYIRYYWTGLVLQHIIQSSILFIAIFWTFNRKWPWVQSGFLTLHSLVMIMKMHSYITVNGHLQYVTYQMKALCAQMHWEAERLGGWDSAIAVAKKAGTQSGDENSSTRSDESTRTSTPIDSKSSPAAYIEPDSAEGLRRRQVPDAANVSTEIPKSNSGRANGDLSVIQEVNGSEISEEGNGRMAGILAYTAPHPLVQHPDPVISSMARDYAELPLELTGPGPEFVRWPNNIGWKNFAVYQLIPTLVYELEYPRTERIRPLYVFEKTVATFGTFALLYSVTESFILPYTPTANESFFRALLELALPFMIAYLLLFYIIFECICNAFAELSYILFLLFFSGKAAHLIPLRRWNSTSWDEFSRKWNKPVYTFLLRHVYTPSIMSYEVSRTRALFFTFFLSAAVHELVMIVVTKKFRLYLFMLQIVQIPLIMISRIPSVKRSRLLGNIVFWVGLYAGFPLLCVTYVAY